MLLQTSAWLNKAMPVSATSLAQDEYLIGATLLLCVQELATVYSRTQLPPRTASGLSDFLASSEGALVATHLHGWRSLKGFVRAAEKHDVLAALLQKLEEALRSREDQDADLVSWWYQYLKRPIERIAISGANKNGTKISGDGLLKATQFFTEPYMVGHLVTKALAPLLRQPMDVDRIRICDPACGAGTFLVAALGAIAERARRLGKNIESEVTAALEHTVVGYELDPSLAGIAAANLFLAAARIVGKPLDVSRAIVSGFHGDELGFLDRANLSRLDRRLRSGDKLVILTNPPFLGRRLMSDRLRVYLQAHYPVAKGDLCASFLIRCIELLAPGDTAGFVHQANWLTLSSLEALRAWILHEVRLDDCVLLGANAFSDLSGEKASVALSTVTKCSPSNAPVPLKTPNASVRTLPHFTDAWWSALSHLPRYADYAKPMQGTSTGDNTRFVKFAWERPADGEWVSASKGGGYAKWAGLNRYIVWWGRAGERVRANPGAALRNLDVIASAPLVYSDTGTLGLNVRQKAVNQIFIASGPGIVVNEGSALTHLAFLNSRLASACSKRLSPKLTTSAGYIGRLPFADCIARDSILADRARVCVASKHRYLGGKLTNDEYVFDESLWGHDVEKTLRDAVARDLREEELRLQAEWEIEKRVLNLLGLKCRNLSSLGAAPHAAQLSGDLHRLTSKSLDSAIAATLDANCQYRGSHGRNKHRFGREGPLEALALQLGIGSAALAAFATQRIDEMRIVLMKYAEDLVHQAVLARLGFNSERTWRAKRVNVSKLGGELIDVLPGVLEAFTSLRVISSAHGLGAWLTVKLPAIHDRVFRNRPVLRLEGQSLMLAWPE